MEVETHRDYSVRLIKDDDVGNVAFIVGPYETMEEAREMYYRIMDSCKAKRDYAFVIQETVEYEDREN